MGCMKEGRVSGLYVLFMEALPASKLCNPRNILQSMLIGHRWELGGSEHPTELGTVSCPLPGPWEDLLLLSSQVSLPLSPLPLAWAGHLPDPCSFIPSEFSTSLAWPDPDCTLVYPAPASALMKQRLPNWSWPVSKQQAEMPVAHTMYQAHIFLGRILTF